MIEARKLVFTIFFAKINSNYHKVFMLEEILYDRYK